MGYIAYTEGLAAYDADDTFRALRRGTRRALSGRMHNHELSVIDPDQLATITGGGKLANAGYAALVVASIAHGNPGGQLHDDPSGGPFHTVQPITTSQAR